MLVVQRVVSWWVPFPPLTIVLLRLKELMVLYGLCVFCVSFLYELFLAFWYWVAFPWVLQEYSVSLEWHWSLYKMALSPTQHCGSTPLFMSFIFLFQISAFPTWWRASSIRFCVFFFKCPKEHLYSLWFLAADLLYCFIISSDWKKWQDTFPYLGQ